MDSRKIIISLLLVIIALLFYVAFKDNLAWYFRKNKITSNASIYNIPTVYNYCIGSYSTNENSGYDEDKCIADIKEFSSVTKKFDNLIKSKSDINCADFSSSFDATTFFHYVGGDLIKMFPVGYENHQPLYRKDTPSGCFNDPYNLDTDHDCEPCENFFK